MKFVLLLVEETRSNSLKSFFFVKADVVSALDGDSASLSTVLLICSKYMYVF